jgi:predicted PurR-regulated permease PerM
VRRDARRGDEGWLNRQRVLSIALGIATLLALYVCFLIIEPFIPTLVFAMALAIATDRPYLWLRRRFHNQRLAAAVAVIFVAFVIIGPLSLLLISIARQIVTSLKELQNGVPLAEWLDAIHGKRWIGDALRWVEANFDIQAQLANLGKTLASRAGNILAGSINLVTQLVIMLFVLFFLFRDREKALATIRALVPLSDDEASRLFKRVADTIRATVNGSLTVGLVQASLATLMYTILGVPAAMLWGSATFIMALIPVFGTFTIWGPISVYLALTGNWVKALVLVGWGALAVGTIDNILYPYLVGDRLRLHTVPTFFAIVGGIGLFGPAGLILGPVTLAITIGLLNVWWSRTTDGGTADDGLAAGNQDHPPNALLDRGDDGAKNQ